MHIHVSTCILGMHSDTCSYVSIIYICIYIYIYTHTHIHTHIDISRCGVQDDSATTLMMLGFDVFFLRVYVKRLGVGAHCRVDLQLVN